MRHHPLFEPLFTTADAPPVPITTRTTMHVPAKPWCGSAWSSLRRTYVCFLPKASGSPSLSAVSGLSLSVLTLKGAPFQLTGEEELMRPGER